MTVVLFCLQKMCLFGNQKLEVKQLKLKKYVWKLIISTWNATLEVLLLHPKSGREELKK